MPSAHMRPEPWVLAGTHMLPMQLVPGVRVAALRGWSPQAPTLSGPHL